MRESIASMVLAAQGLDLSDCSVLDAFAGSGAVGLELLSRGARSCTFCERDRKTSALIRRNCQKMGAGEAVWRVLCGDVFRLAERGLWGAPFSVVFLDPPYAMDAREVARLVEVLGETGQLASDGLVLYERSNRGEELPLTGARLIRTRKMASSCIDLLRMGEYDE
jgi:16S rRNA (guanine966-N2)-methyltransferase